MWRCTICTSEKTQLRDWTQRELSWRWYSYTHLGVFQILEASEQACHGIWVWGGACSEEEGDTGRCFGIWDIPLAKTSLGQRPVDENTIFVGATTNFLRAKTKIIYSRRKTTGLENVTHSHEGALCSHRLARKELYEICRKFNWGSLTSGDST